MSRSVASHRTAQAAEPGSARQTARGRRQLFARTALCGALLGFVLAPAAQALPSLNGTPQVNAGGSGPVFSGGAGETDVALHAPRTIIDWSSFNVASGEKVSFSFDSRSAIVLNRIGGSATPEIDGIVEGKVGGSYGGNIWFAAKNGLIFGNGAQVDAGGILVSTAAPDTSGFLNPGNTTFAFPGSEVVNVQVVGMATGSQITGHGGLVAMIAPQVVTQSGTSITGANGSTVLYGAATGFTLRLAQNAPGDFDLVDFVVTDPSKASILLDLQNTTNANSVFVAAVSSNSASSVVINLEGLTTAQSASVDGGDIVLSGGGGIVGRQASPNASATPTDIYLRTLSASRDIQVQTTGQIFGQPWVRPPPPPPIVPPVIEPPPDDGMGNGAPNGNGNGPPSNGGNGAGGCINVIGPGCIAANGDIFLGFGRTQSGPESLTLVRTDATDSSQVSALSSGRDIVLKGSQTIALGSASAGRDLTTDSARLQANSLTVTRTASLTSETGDIAVGALKLSGAATIGAAGSVEIDSASLSGGASATLNVSAGANIGFGDGKGSASGGVITLKAAGDVNVNLASATIDSVTAGGTANVQAGTLSVNRISGAQVVAGGDNVTVKQATSAGDIYIGATGNAALLSGTAGDDIYVLANTGTAALTSATLTGLGRDTVGVGFAGARDALAQSGRLLAAGEADGALNVWLRSRLEADFAGLELAAGQPGAAADRYANAIAILRTRHAGTATEGGLLLQLGKAQAAAGREDAALGSFGRAFALFQSQRGSLGASADEAGPYFDLLLARMASDPAHADDYRARFFSASETVVSNATAQTVSKLAARVASGDGAITGLVRGLDDTKRELRAAEARIANLQAQGAYAGEAKTELDAQLKTLQQQADTLEAQLLAANPRYGQLVAASANLSDLQKTLRKDEVYLKVVMLGGRGYGMVVTPASSKAYRIDLSREQAASDVRVIRAPFEAENGLPMFDIARSYALFQKLAGPAKAEILAAKHMIYEPDGALIALPAGTFVLEDPAPLLAGLPKDKDPDYRKVAWLGARLDSSLVLSAPSFMQSRAFTPSKAKHPFLAFADPASAKTEPNAFSSVLKRSGTVRGGNGVNVCEGTRQALLRLPELPDTADEVRKVGASMKTGADDILIGKSFTDEAVKGRSDLNDFKVLYFATHGLLPQPSACLPEPALVTSVGVGADSDGLLDASEILDLKLDADLVVLSACDTGGAGSESSDLTGLQGGGEALGGLTRAVIYAGGRSLVVSHWSVDSAATVRLMTGLFSSRAGSESEALQQAQVALQQSAEWSHPYFWAPFTIVGDGSRAMPTAGVAAGAGQN